MAQSHHPGANPFAKKAILPVFNPNHCGVHMGIAVLSLAELFSPLQALAHRWMTPRRRARSADLRYVAIRPACTARADSIHQEQGCDSPAKPLRVIRVVDGRSSSRSSSRVVISGRMADVCAELDRLVALEAHQPSSGRMH
jgi:hypothetical protein